MIHTFEPLEMLTERYHTQKFLLLPQFLDAPETGRLLASTKAIPIRRVICGNPDIHFGQQNFVETHPLGCFFHERQVVEMVLALAQATRLHFCRCWTLVYGPGEYINAHRDRAGQSQLLICLRSPSDAKCGGSLLLNAPTGSQQVFLTQGDAILFEASGVEHATTPLLSSEQDPYPQRVIAVGRYFFE